MSDVGVVIVAAGSGSRAGGNAGELKQFRWVAGKPMLLHSIQRFHARGDVAMVVCVLPRDRAADPPPWIFQCDLDRFLITVGGNVRGDSVRNGLEDLPHELPIILIHDAARPLVPDSVIEAVISGARAGRVTVPALPVHDTIKRLAADETGRVLETVDRTALTRVQTPQGFPREVIVEAHSRAWRGGLLATDDAALCEAIGADVFTVPGSERSLKITTEADFAIAEALAAVPA